MTLVDTGFNYDPAGFPEPSREPLNAAQREQLVAHIVSAWPTIVPRVGDQALITEVELADWDRLPLWQKDSIRANDPRFTAHGTGVVQAVLDKIRAARAALPPDGMQAEDPYAQ
jgi:hypothetical protein